MGGKHKQAQRTKNNTRPSSSGRSAELLGSTLPQFVGFSSKKDSTLASSDFTFISDDVEALVDSNFQLVFKKMNKKDSITKLKALQEFTDLVKAAEVEAIKTILPLWPRLYCALAIDSEHKVREATQLAHHQLVLKAKRNIAPYLKQLAGTWFISQYDTYAPAASAASRAFQDSFPHNKIQEAIIFCQEEILSYICDNLTMQTPQTLTNAKMTLSEDADAKYQRIIISSLNSYALYLSKVPSNQIEKHYDLNLKIISNVKFWKLCKNKTPPVRLAFFSVLTMLCQKAPLLMDKESAHIVGSVFSNLDEHEPTVLPAVWEAALSILSMMHEWWKYVNIDKLVLPKLYKVLKDGGSGNAAVIFPNLLPLLSHLPNVIDENVVYMAFFESMRVGLRSKNVLTSRSQSQAVSVALIECLQYIIMKNQSDVALCEKLIKTQLFPLLEWSFNDSQACYKSLYNQVAKLIQFWDRNHKDYEKYLAYFWHNLESLYIGLLLNLTHSCEVAPAQLATRQIELITSLKHLTKNKRLLKVSFNPEEHSTVEQNLSANFSKTYWSSLNLLVYKTCEAYVKVTNEKRSRELIEHLASLIRNFDSESFFCQCGLETKSKFCDIYKDILLKWLNDDELCSKAVVDLIFLLFKYFDDDEKAEVLDKFCNALKEECLGWCVARALSFPNCEAPIVIKWLCNVTVNLFLISIAEKEVSNDSTPELNLILKQAFTEKANGDLIITKTTIESILEILIRPLLDPDTYSTTLDACASFVSYISTTIYTPHFKLTYGNDLVLALFALSNCTISEDVLSADTCWEINTTWQDVISLLSQETPYADFKAIVEKCSTIILKTRTEKSAGLINNFIKIVANNSPLWLKDVLILFLKHDFVDKWREEIRNICEQAKCIRGGLYMVRRFEQESISINDNEIENYFEWMDLVVSVLVKPLEDESKVLFEHLMDLLQDECDIFILDLFSTSILSECFVRNYQCVKSTVKVKETSAAFQDKLYSLINNLNPNHNQTIESLLLNKLNEGSWLWTNCLYDFYLRSGTHDLSNIYTDIVNQTVNTDRRMLLLQVTQTWAKHITYDQIWGNRTALETIIVLRSIIFKPELEVQIAEAFALVDSIKRQNQNDFLCNSNADWEKIQLIIEIIRLFSSIVRYKSESIQTHQWDFVLTSFVTWCENVAKSLNNDVQKKLMIVALTDLFVAISDYVENNENQISIEWKDVFAQDVHSTFVKIWCYYADYHQLHPHVITDLPFLQDFGKMLFSLDTSRSFAKNYSVKWFRLLTQSLSLLTHRASTLQLWGYHMLAKLIPGLVKIDATSVGTNTPHEKGLVIGEFKTTLVHTQEIVQSMLLEFRLGEDSCRVEPFTDSYTYTFAYLLLWDVLLCLCKQSSPEVCYQYSDWLRKEDLVDYLLMNLFKLIPLEVESKQFSHWFIEKCPLEFTETPTSQLIERKVCWIYSQAVMQLPVLIRQWWCNQDSRVAQLVERVTSTFVSSHLCNQELTNLTKYQHKFKNMTFKVHPAVREVVAVYTVDEVNLVLVITLPPNYPLVGPDVHCDERILGTMHRQWLLQLKMCVFHQDGRVWDGLLLWNNNLHKRFDGVEECYICFAVIHHGTYHIPKLVCQTCKKKFHSACLYKWFSTSNKSSCPVCRNLF